jgi:transposase
MDIWEGIRRKVLVEGVSKRQILRETGIHWTTLKKILNHSIPPGYRQTGARHQPKIGPFLGRVRQILDDDKKVHKKQRHTAKRIFERLREEGYQGGYTQVKAAVHEMERVGQEVFVPLEHRPGEAQVDFGHAVFKFPGQVKAEMRPFFVMALPYSDAIFVQVFERENTEYVWEGHIRAFEHFGGVPNRISYDNTKVMVAQILGVHRRKLTHAFLQMVSHYLFEPYFCTVRRGNEKGVVEGIVKYARLNFMVPVPQIRSLEEFNLTLIDSCRNDLKRRLRGKEGAKEDLFKQDQAAFLPLPAARFDACAKISTMASSLSLVRFDTNDYSVPAEYAHHPVVVKGYVNRIVISHKEKVIATHPRHWGKEGAFFQPVHYLAVLERKPGAFDHARPLKDWQLPECFALLRRRLEAFEKNHGEGTREYIRVLRLLERHSLPALTRAVKQALKFEVASRDAVAQFLLPNYNPRLTLFSLDGREHLKLVRVDKQDIGAYRDLFSLGGVQ